MCHNITMRRPVFSIQGEVLNVNYLRTVTMEQYKWLLEILFGGLGTTLIGYLFFKAWKHHQVIQKQKSGKNSTNILAGRDIKINKIRNYHGKK